MHSLRSLAGQGSTIKSILPIAHSPEYVCLVDEDNREIGIREKSRVHGPITPLHRAFSIFLFNDQGSFLVQQRAFSKLTWPGIWSNSCCGHPAPGEDLEAAAIRRLQEELRLQGGRLHLALPHFRYRASYLGIEENEICPVFVGRIEGVPDQGNPNEIASLDWMDWEVFRKIATSPVQLGVEGGKCFHDFSPWSIWEARLLSGKELEWQSRLAELSAFKCGV